MPRTKMQELSELGQSLWLDFINRPLLETGKLQKLIESGLRGMTSNPTIFNQSISLTQDYDDKIVKWKEAGKSTFEIYDELTIQDIQEACDIFRSVYESTRKLDGFVSLEINPKLAHDTLASIAEGLRLFERVDRPNVMIKVPATDAGFPVIEELIANAVNVNVTLIFSLKQYERTVESYFRGLKRLLKIKKDLGGVRSVASVFVSRIDTMVDKMLEERATAQSDLRIKLDPLKGQAAVANCRLIYEEFKEQFQSETFKELFQNRANEQRVLWGSTGTKNSNYSDIKYITELIAKPTVNTVPEKTLEAFLDHGILAGALDGDVSQAKAVLQALAQYQIDINQVCAQLLVEGVALFEKSFDELLASIEQKANRLSMTGK